MPISGLLRDPLKMTVKANNSFALDLYGVLRQAPGNLFFSPISLALALGMTYAGARGETQRQMARTLHFAGLQEDDLHAALGKLASELVQAESQTISLRMANRLYPQAGYSFLPAFIDCMQKNYGTSISAVDYVKHREEARQAINRWVAGQTEDRIQELIGPTVLTALTRLVLVNAIYFKGAWQEPFDQQKTQEAPFWVSPGQPVTAALMSAEQQLDYVERDGMQMVALPFAGQSMVMVMILPSDPAGLETLEASLTFKQLDDWLNRTNVQKVRLQIPKFRLEGAFRLNEVLKKLGMPDAFDADRANFAGMDGKEKSLYISDVLHKAFIEANEAGAEAAAATAVVMALRAAPMRVPTFRADHPFLFLIRGQSSGSILFLGRLVDPSGV